MAMKGVTVICTGASECCAEACVSVSVGLMRYPGDEYTGHWHWRSTVSIVGAAGVGAVEALWALEKDSGG